MTKKVIRKQDIEFKLYPETDADGAVMAPVAVAELLNHVEALFEKNMLNEHSQGVYFTLCELLSCPMASLESKAIELLTDVIDETIDEEEDDDEQEGEAPMITKESVYEDISDEELEKEFEKEEEEKKKKQKDIVDDTHQAWCESGCY